MVVEKIELLAPAASLEVARVALSAGADAVYIGAPRYGARSSAGVSLEEISTLAREAHAVGAKVYVALNTILKDEELQEAVEMVPQLYEVGVDALIVQDMGFFLSQLPPMPLHASTQCHNDRPEKLRLLEELGVEQVVLPREVSSSDLLSLFEGLEMRVECFVHGALCVSYSGRCYISEACQGRCANRGSCAHYCRMSYDLVDAEGHTLRQGQHLLSLRDLNRSELLEELLERGVSSLKIEGRLKGKEYVRNVTAHYRRRLDQVIAKAKGRYQASSWGEVSLTFQPAPERSFSRLFTSYNTPLHQPIPVESITPLTNKSMGEWLGEVVINEGRRLVILLREKGVVLANGDGLLLVAEEQQMTVGAMINGVTPLGNGACQLRLSSSVAVPIGTKVYRNLNHQLEQQLQRSDASERKVSIYMMCRARAEGVELSASIAEEPCVTAHVWRAMPLELAKRDNSDRIEAALEKLGGTPYRAEQVTLELGGFYLPLSVATELRRGLVEQLQEACHQHFIKARDERGRVQLAKRNAFWEREHKASAYGLPTDLDFTYNVANSVARDFYRRLGVTGEIAPAMEVAHPEGPTPVMYTRHCLLHQVGYCTREGRKPPFWLPLYLVRGKERFRVSTNCRDCLMTLWKEG